MRKSKLLWVFGLILAVFISFPSVVNASTATDEIMRVISPDLQTITLKSVVPKSDIEGDYLMNSILAKYIGDIDGYEYYGYCEGDGYTTCLVDIWSDDYRTEWDSEKQETVVLSGEKASYILNATYDVPSYANVAMMDKFVSKIATSSETYEIGDLSLINYYLTGTKSELWNYGAPSRALKFVSELHEITEGSDVNFFMEARMGTEDEVLMYEDATGPMSIYYGDYAYNYINRTLYLKRVIYIPEDTEDTKEAYVEAAQERINNYLGVDNGVVVSYGGLLSSLEDGAEDEELSLISDGNFYNISVLGRTYKFYIIEDDDKLEVPTYSAKNISTDISVTSNSGNIPLDTTINANKVTSGTEYERIIGILDLDGNVTYDVKLYSNAKEEYITKLDNGTFNVRIPIPEELKGKTLVVYYVNEDGTVEPYEVTPDGDYAEFNTEHFSVYTLGYREGDSVKVEFDANGGKFGNSDSYVIDAWDASLYDTLKYPTREGYKFKGYFTEKTGGTKFEMILNEAGIDSDSVYYAQWEKVVDNPNTGDSIISYLIIGIGSLTVLGVSLLSLKKKVRAN